MTYNIMSIPGISEKKDKIFILFKNPIDLYILLMSNTRSLYTPSSEIFKLNSYTIYVVPYKSEIFIFLLKCHVTYGKLEASS